MDLRSVITSDALRTEAERVLNYQPFIISDDVQTGAAYSWVYGVNVKSATPVVFRRQEHGEDWDKITDSNARCRRMYDDWISVISRRYAGGSFLDVACNNGYFPVKALLSGMGRAVGAEGGGYFGESVAFLNKVLGTSAEFIPAFYDPQTHTAPIAGKFDIVSASAIMNHLPDPMDFMAYLGTLANEAVFYFGQVVDTDALIVCYLKPHPTLGEYGKKFPYRFNDGTRLSRGLLYHAFEEIGFSNIYEFPWKSEWLSPYIYQYQTDPILEHETRPDVLKAWKINCELLQGSKHVAILATR
jgi:hypothetical protein